jgi:hypothetical protein
MELPLVAVADGFVFVGIGVLVAVGTTCVGVCVPVGGPGVVGSEVGAARVGNGLAPKLNKAVGVACVATLGKMIGLGGIAGELRGPAGNNVNRIEQRQQNTSKNKPGKSVLPSCPCWL